MLDRDSHCTDVLKSNIESMTRSLLQVWIFDGPRFWYRIGDRAAFLTLPIFLGRHECLDGSLDLGAEIRAVKGGLVHDFAALLTVPAHAVDSALRPLLLKYHADGVSEAYGVMRRVSRQQKHVALPNNNVPKLAIVNDLQHHSALVLVEPLRSLVNVVVRPGVGTTDDLEQ